MGQLDFQQGVMLFNQTDSKIYVLRFGAGWNSYDAPGDGGLLYEVGPEAGIYVPGGVFGELWHADTSLVDEIGHALTPAPTSFTASAQAFSGGLMVATQSTVYVLYSDLTWDWFSYSAGS